jgi:hypothetical protein
VYSRDLIFCNAIALSLSRDSTLGSGRLGAGGGVLAVRFAGFFASLTAGRGGFLLERLDLEGRAVFAEAFFVGLTARFALVFVLAAIDRMIQIPQNGQLIRMPNESQVTGPANRQ